MTTDLNFKTADFEAVYGGLEALRNAQVEVWGLEEGRRAALLAYADGGDDEFGWSNWVTEAYDDPSEAGALFDDLVLVVDDAVAAQLRREFPGVFTTAA
jgi:hypothetical protein